MTTNSHKTTRQSTPTWIWVAVAVFAAGGLALRLARFGDTVFGDELSTLWIVRNHGFFDTISVVNSDVEISPPLYFLLAWVSTHLDLGAPDLVRLPALVAGFASIPLAFLVGSRAINAITGLIAAAVIAFSPSLIAYSVEGRSYSVAIALLLISTLAMLLAIDTSKRRWWSLYAVATCLSMYSHYTAAFALGAQLIWLCWAHPEARRPALVANLGAAIAFLPWLGGFIADANSPTVAILAALQGTGFAVKREAVEQLVFGTPYVASSQVPGSAAVAVGAAGGALAIVVTIARVAKPGLSALARRFDEQQTRRLVLFFVLGLATPVGEAIITLAGGTDLFGSRNLLTSSPGLALLAGAVIYGAGPAIGALSAAALLVAGGIGIVKSSDARYRQVNFKDLAELLDEQARPGDVVIDPSNSYITPAPLTPLAVYLRNDTPVYLTDHQSPASPSPDEDEVIDRVFTAASGHRVFYVDIPLDFAQSAAETSNTPRIPPAGWKVVERDRLDGILPLTLLVCERTDGGHGS